ncbi:hypothetical protein LR48_Vigan01g138900 [Vigna angularis]|uniref:CCG-binding protein n=1 Tax=Phaseolus angularis TaxID=3914 RepID=A0A0L9TML4_PHAAN|nr:CCG-binding protein 1 [Vigna angularis]KAG2409106.1 CCG-binding protein [Vigna angularis]KOM31833.1 hypothetical protein LR48_Vigan01g138900 [Vigna angularis]
MKTTLLRPCCTPLFLDAHSNRTSSTGHASFVVCSSSRNQPYIPKLEPFSRTKFERAVKDPPLIEKSEKELSDYCLTLEGEESYSCWQAYFELKDLEKETPKKDIERLILETGGVKSLIGCLHGITSMQKVKKDGIKSSKDVKSEEGERQCPIPDGLPKSDDELREEEESKMPDSPYTKLLRTMGRHPAWYSPAPDHETD